MTMQTLYRLKCDQKFCDAVQVVASESQLEARALARVAGWSVGPFRRKTSTGTLVVHTDFCPAHHKDDSDAEADQ